MRTSFARTPMLAAVGAGLALLAVWVGVVVQSGPAYALSLAGAYLPWLPAPIAGAALYAALAGVFYRSAAPDEPSPWVILLGVPRMFVLAPLFGTLTLFALTVDLAREIHRRGRAGFRDWPGDALSHPRAGLPIWVMYWPFVALKGRRQLRWHHGEMHEAMRRWAPLVIVGVGFFVGEPGDPAELEKPEVLAVIGSLWVTDYLLLWEASGAWAQAEGPSTADTR